MEIKKTIIANLRRYEFTHKGFKTKIDMKNTWQQLIPVRTIIETKSRIFSYDCVINKELFEDLCEGTLLSIADDAIQKSL